MTTGSIRIGNENIGVGIHQFQYNRDGTNVGWDYVVDAAGSDLHATDTPGSWAEVRFYGTSFRLFGSVGPDGGVAEITVDDGPPLTVDCYRDQPVHPSLLFNASDLLPGLHRLRLQAAGRGSEKSQGAFIRIGYAEVIGDSSSAVLDIGGLTVGEGLHQFHYLGEWERVEGSGYGGGHRMAEQSGAAFTFRFEGRQVQLFGLTGPLGGYAELTLDDGPARSVSFYADVPQPGQPVYTSEWLPQGSHLLRLRVAGEPGAGQGRRIAVDRIAVATDMPPVAAVDIHTDAVRQRIESFSASSGWAIDPIGQHWAEANKAKIADLLYDEDRGIGLSSFRFYIGAGSSVSDVELMHDPFRRVEVFQASEGAEYDWSRQAGQRWMMQAAKTRGVQEFLAFTHSAPFWMNKNGHTKCDPNDETTNLKEGYEPAFAKFLADVVAHFRDEEGVPFDYISPINEPGWTWDNVHEEGNRSDNDDMLRIIHALDEELARRGLATRIIGPEAAHLEHFTEKGYLEALFGPAGVRERLSHIVSGHSYFTDNFEEEAIPVRRRLKERIDAFGGLTYWQTEYCLMGRGIGQQRDYGITPALWMAKVMHADLTLLDAATWHWWLSVSPGNFNFKDGLIYTDWFEPGDEENVIASKMLWAFGNFSKYIRPGAVRVELTGLESSTQFMASAYWLEERKQVIAVFVNETQNERPVRLQVAGKAVASFKAFVTSDLPGDDLKEADLSRGSDEYVIPPRSVVTLVGALSYTGQ